MLSKIKVGKTYRNKDTKEKRTVIFIGNKYVLFTVNNEGEYPVSKDICLHSWEEIPEEMWVSVSKDPDDGEMFIPSDSNGNTIYLSKKEALKQGSEVYRLVKE